MRLIVKKNTVSFQRGISRLFLLIGVCFFLAGLCCFGSFFSWINWIICWKPYFVFTLRIWMQNYILVHNLKCKCDIKAKKPFCSTEFYDLETFAEYSSPELQRYTHFWWMLCRFHVGGLEGNNICGFNSKHSILLENSCPRNYISPPHNSLEFVYPLRLSHGHQLCSWCALETAVSL